MTAYTSTIHKTRLSAENKVAKLMQVAQAAAKCLDLYSTKQNGRRVFVASAVRAIGSTWENLFIACQNYGMDEAENADYGAPETAGGGGALAGAKNFGVVASGHVFKGYTDAPSGFVMPALRLIDVANFANQTRLKAITKFASLYGEFPAGNDFALVDMADLSVVQWRRGGVSEPLIATPEILGDALLHKEGDTRGYIVTAALVTVGMASVLAQAYYSNMLDTERWIVTPISVTERVIDTRNYFQIEVYGGAAVGSVLMPQMNAPDADFYVTQAAAIEAGAAVQGYLHPIRRMTAFVNTPLSREAEPVPTPTPTPTPAGTVFAIFMHGHIYKGDADTVDSFVTNAKQNMWIGRDTTEAAALLALNQQVGWFPTTDMTLVDLDTLRVVRSYIGGAIDATAGRVLGDCVVQVEQSIYAETLATINPLKLHYLARAGFGDNGDELRSWTVKPVGAAGYDVATRNYYQYHNRETGVSTPDDLAADYEFFETWQAAADAVLLIDEHALDAGGYVFDPVLGYAVYTQGGAYEVRARLATFVAGVL